MLPNEVALRLSQLSRLLDVATADLEHLDEAATRAKCAFEVAYARSFLTGEGAVDARKQQAVLACADEHLAAEIAAAKVRACRARISTLGTQIDVGRSLGASIRSEISLAGVAS